MRFKYLALALILVASHITQAAPTPAPIFVRVALTAPADRAWRVHVIAQMPAGKSHALYVGKTVAEAAKGVEWLPATQASGWIDLSDPKATSGMTVRFLFETQPALATAGVEARIDIATAASDDAIVRTITDHDPGNVVAVRIPANPAADKPYILSIREDTQRRLDEIKSWNLPDAPRPQKLWCMTGFRSNGEFYTDPAIARMDFEIIRRLGMNGFWQQNGGQPGDLREMAKASGMNRSTVYWRSVESPPRDKELAGRVRLKWDALDDYLDKSYRQSIQGTRKQHPNGMPDEIIADLMDEPAGLPLGGPEYAAEFRQYAQRQGQTPATFGKTAWPDVSPIELDWRTFFARRDALNLADEPTRRLLYWSSKFWNYAIARLYASATRKVEQYAPGGTVGTRVNFGPPWVYDYGTLPRGIDAFEFGRLRGVTLGFNEDWVGAGNPRVPLEINTLLIDWSRAAARPATPLLGSYITRDADRATVKLRTFACLAREAKVFDFYYYGPAYTFFDHWSDNASMVRGVAELTRDLGAVDDLLWAGRAPAAHVALLYSQSWPVWKHDDTEQTEQLMAYLALLHAGLPVDIVSDTEVADGRFAARRYDCLYVVNESIPTVAALEIERWVHNGGRLWASGWAGMKDEYDTPSDRWNEMLGVKSRSWKPAGDLKRLGQPIKPDDWKRPIFGREVTIEPADHAEARPINKDDPAYQRKHGAGTVQVVPRTAGKAYMDGATEKPGSLAKATLFPTDARRQLYTDFATRAATATPPATTSVSQILAWPLWSQRGGVILLANYTGEAATDLRVTFTTPLPVTKARSLRHGDLKLTRTDPEHLELTLPMNEVTDILVLE